MDIMGIAPPSAAINSRPLSEYQSIDDPSSRSSSIASSSSSRASSDSMRSQSSGEKKTLYKKFKKFLMSSLEATAYANKEAVNSGIPYPMSPAKMPC